MVDKIILEDGRYTFWDLIKKYKIVIPMIQRDYVQGKEDKKINTIRKNLIDSIRLAIDGEKRLDFDFIYGSTKMKENETEELSLLDGQQRITTLFLIYWYFATKEGKITNEIKRILHNFSYQNRVSSRDFCKSLIDEKLEIKKDEAISSQIKNKTWYFNEWDNDPTIKNMLNMLDCIHKNFYEKDAFEDLIDSKKKLISFYFVPLEKFNLTDELYIKMNSRVKKLTNFEIFKSKMIEIIKVKKDDELLETFSRKVETDWANLFFEYRKENEITIDEIFMRYVYYITEMIYATRISEKTSKDSEKDSPFDYDKNTLNLNLKLIEETYKDKENIKLLIDFLNIWKTKEDLNNDINNTFSNKYEEGKVALFKENINLFENCIYAKDFDLFDKVMLYAFLLKKKNNRNDKEYDDLRIIRNIILNIRWFSKATEEYISNLRYYMLREYFETFEKIIGTNSYDKLIKLKDNSVKETFNTELQKAMIISLKPELKKVIFECEDTNSTKGNLSNLLELIEENSNKIINFVKILNNNSYYTLIYRAMLSFEDYGINVGNSRIGDRFFYGESDRIYDIVTYTTNIEIQRKIKVAFKKIYNKLQETDFGDIKNTLNNIIDENIKVLPKNEWLYNILKYEDIWELSFERSINKNNPVVYTFAIKNINDFGIDNVEIASFSRKSTNSRHINPYYKPILKYYNLKKEQECYTTNDDNGKIILDNGIIIKMIKEGFQIFSIDKADRIKELFNVKNFDAEGGILIKYNKQLDYIEQEKNLIDKIINI